MLPDEQDTIAAIATPPAPAIRGVVRIAGPDTLKVLSGVIDTATADQLDRLRSASLIPDARVDIELAGVQRSVLADLYVWPSKRSYVRQPSVELHLAGSTPLLEAVVRSLCGRGARLAEPGEFTLRAVLSGRIDLTQAEAVLGVIDARGEHDLRTALRQLSGGLAGPLAEVREGLLGLLAEIEAGLDFVDEEDVRFIDPYEVERRLGLAQLQVAAIARQASERTVGEEAPSVVLAGPPNAGKSTLFNALVAMATRDNVARSPALVSEVAGSTRDRLSAVLSHQGQTFELFDTAGEAAAETDQAVDSLVQSARREAVGSASVVVLCQPGTQPTPDAGAAAPGQIILPVVTKADLAVRPGALDGLRLSAKTGQGVGELLTAIHSALEQSAQSGAMVASTATRCRASLVDANACLERAAALARSDAEELLSLEVRSTLDALGRVTGAVVTDDVLDRIFSRFCIGK